jgi:hypothetical protein
MTPEQQASLLVPCPVCHQPKGQPCTSRHAVTVHAARKLALRDLEKQADRILRGGR